MGGNSGGKERKGRRGGPGGSGKSLNPACELAKIYVIERATSRGLGTV